MQLDTLKNYDPDRGNLESLVEMLAYGKMIRDTYEALEESGVETPGWIEPKLKRIRREIIARTEDRLRAKLAQAKTRLETHKTPAERKRGDQAEIKRLEAQLAEIGD